MPLKRQKNNFFVNIELNTFDREKYFNYPKMLQAWNSWLPSSKFIQNLSKKSQISHGKVEQLK